MAFDAFLFMHAFFFFLEGGGQACHKCERLKVTASHRVFLLSCLRNHWKVLHFC